MRTDLRGFEEGPKRVEAVAWLNGFCSTRTEALGQVPGPGERRLHRGPDLSFSSRGVSGSRRHAPAHVRHGPGEPARHGVPHPPRGQGGGWGKSERLLGGGGVGHLRHDAPAPDGLQQPARWRGGSRSWESKAPREAKALLEARADPNNRGQADQRLSVAVQMALLVAWYYIKAMADSKGIAMPGARHPDGDRSGLAGPRSHGGHRRVPLDWLRERHVTGMPASVGRLWAKSVRSPSRPRNAARGVSGSGVASVNAVYTEQDPEVIPIGFSLTCAEQRWDSEKMRLGRLSDPACRQVAATERPEDALVRGRERRLHLLEPG